MCDYMPVEVIIEILKRLPVKSVVRFRSVCKSWNTLFSDLSFISTHLQASLSNNTPFLLIECQKNCKKRFSLHYDNAGFEEFKHLRFPPFYCVIGSCNGLICVQLYPSPDVSFNIVLWNPSVQRYISLPPATGSELLYFNIGFGFDSRTNDYKILIVGIDKDCSWIQPYLFSLNKNRWKRVTGVYPNYAFRRQIPLPFVNGAIHLLGYRRRNDGGYSHVILGFDLSAEEFFELNLPESLIGLRHFDLSIMKYGESSIAVSTHPRAAELHELWVMKEYGVVESWTKVLTLHSILRNTHIPRVMGFRKNGEVLLQVHFVKMASFDLNCQNIELHGVDIGANLFSVHSYVESLVLLDKAVHVCSESDVNHPLDSSIRMNRVGERVI